MQAKRDFTVSFLAPTEDLPLSATNVHIDGEAVIREDKTEKRSGESKSIMTKLWKHFSSTACSDPESLFKSFALVNHQIKRGVYVCACL